MQPGPGQSKALPTSAGGERCIEYETIEYETIEYETIEYESIEYESMEPPSGSGIIASTSL